MAERVAVVQAAFDAYFRGDEPAMFALVDPEIVVTQFPEQVDVRPYHGHDGLRRVMVSSEREALEAALSPDPP